MLEDVYSRNVICEAIKQIRSKDKKPKTGTIFQCIQKNHGECDPVLLQLETIEKCHCNSPQANDKTGESNYVIEDISTEVQS